MKSNAYIPALRFDWLTGFYDSILSGTLKEEAFKRMLIEQAAIEPTHRVLDLGCGTGTLTIMLKEACPDATILGLDGDPKVLDIARAKVEASGVDVELHQGLAFDPPFEPRSFDKIVSSLVFHHLHTDDKRRTLAHTRELLRPGGELHIADWGKAQNGLMRVAFLGVQLLDGFATTSDNVRGHLVPMMQEAGFLDVSETHRAMTMLGTLSLYRATAPA